MKQLKLFFALFAMLALGVGNAWGETKTIEITQTALGLGGSYSTSSIAIDEVTFNWTDLMKNSSNIQAKASSGEIWNSTPIPGNIVSVAVTHSGTARSSTMYFGASAKDNKESSTFSGTSTITPTGEYKYFYIKRSSNAAYWTKIVITYETAGDGGETPDPTPDPEPEPDPTPGTGETWTLVTNTSDLKAGDQIVIAATGSDYALGPQANNNRTAVAITKTGNNITWTTDVQIITLETGNKANTFAFNTGSGYLYAASSSNNYLKTKTNLDDNGSWAITITSEGVATIKAQGSYTRNWIRKNSSSAIFSCYGSGQSDVAIYKKVTSTDEPGSGETVPSLTQDQFSWSATTATATLPNTFDNPPTLTNTEGLAVSYSSSKDEVATIDANGNVTLVGVGTADIKATAGGEGTNFKETIVYYTLTVNKAPATPTDNVYVKVTSTAGITNGDYLIVYEDATAPVAFNGALTTLDAVSNNIAVTISSNTIAGNTDIDAATFTIDATAKTVKSKSGYYIGQTSDANGLKANTSTKYENALSIENDGTATVKSGGAYLRYNSDANNWRFRYYKSSSYSGQKAIALYKKASKHTVTIADCTNGIVSAKMGETALATNDQVLSGIQITLSNEAATGYKLAAYDVYKTGEESTKVTVTDGKFIMPEFDVIISATFELAKTLTGIEITTPATQTTFWQGETFNYEGLKVIAHFDGAADEDVTDKVTVTGSTATAGTQTVSVSFKEGEVTKDATYTITVKAIPNTKETAYTVAEAYDIIDKLTTAEGVFISGIISQVDSYNSTYKSITYWISADGTTTNQLQVYSGKGLESADFSGKTDLSVGDQVIVCGNLKKYDGTYEFDKNNYLAVHTKTTKADPELSYTTTEYNVNLGDAFTAPTLNNPHTLAVTYSSSNEDVATVAADGAVTIKAAGTVTITASFAGNDNYVAGSASYTINITDPNQSDVTFVAGTDKSDELTITKTPISLTLSNGTLSRDDHYRIYANAKATFSAAEGYIITKVVLTSTASNDSQYGPGLLSTEEGTYTYSGKEGTWVGEAYTVTLTATAQTRATLITVYYKQDNRVDAGLAWNPATVSLTVGDAFTVPKFSNPNSVSGITFTSDNEALATVTNAGVISLVSGKTGIATITATYAGDATYKPKEVTCIITVNPKTEDVVIVAQREGKWYALKATIGSAANSLAALEVEYVNGVLYNVPDEDKASITWKRSVVGNIETFQYEGKYLKGKTSTDLFMEEGAEGLYQWDKNAHTMLIGSTNRTFLYQGTYFKNYAISNAGRTVDENTYSALPIVTAAKFENATIEKRDSLDIGNFGTICYKNKITNYEGVTFYAVAGREGRKVIFDEVTELEAGMPYLFRAEAAELKIAFGNETASEPGYYNSLQGTFTQIDPAEENILTGNYVMYNNMIKKCGKNCGLKANRAYFIGGELESLGAPAPQAPGRKRVSMDVLGEDEATGVDNITENGVVAPAMQGTYDIMGRQLSEPTATGFYIVNGKKVFVVK